jgi:hypothetical protein
VPQGVLTIQRLLPELHDGTSELASNFEGRAVSLVALRGRCISSAVGRGLPVAEVDVRNNYAIMVKCVVICVWVFILMG